MVAAAGELLPIIEGAGESDLLGGVTDPFLYPACIPVLSKFWGDMLDAAEDGGWRRMF